MPFAHREAARTASRWGVDWLLWKVAGSSHTPEGILDVKYRFTIPDLIEALAYIDAVEAVLGYEREQAERRAKRRGRG